MVLLFTTTPTQIVDRVELTHVPFEEDKYS
jgi:hypothetical protein